MNSLELFNYIFASEKERSYSASLLDFFNTEVIKRLPDHPCIIDLGSGSKSLFEEELGLDRQMILAVDFSSVAIEKAHGKSEVKYAQVDVTVLGSLGIGLYDLVFDSHCLHCIVEIDKRKSAFNNIYNALKSDGVAAFEMMVSSSRHSSNFPGKYIVEARELEEEILSHGFKIIFFVVVRDLFFENEDSKCDLLRVIVRK